MNTYFIIISNKSLADDPRICVCTNLRTPGSSLCRSHLMGSIAVSAMHFSPAGR